MNAADEETRSKLMPINIKYPLAELIKAVKYYILKKPKNPFTFEYVMIKGINDTEKYLTKLIKLCKPLKCKVNLIVFNPSKFVDSSLLPSDDKTVGLFFDMLNRNKIRAIIRKSKGKNISGACGQLAGEF